MHSIVKYTVMMLDILSLLFDLLLLSQCGVAHIQQTHFLPCPVSCYLLPLSPLRWTDLIVGAPNFFDRKAEIGGAVYVYLNPSGHWDKDRPIRLNGTYDSMFGMTVNSVGDLDQDGYDGEDVSSKLHALSLLSVN